jgi:hypothetical protein
MVSRIKLLLSALLLTAGIGITPVLYAAAPKHELTGFPKIYQKWFEDAAAEFNVPVELLQSMAYAETRWRPIVPKGQAKKNGEDFQEVDWHEGDMPPAYGIMGLRNDTYFGTSLNQAAALIREMPATLVTDTRANIRGAAALLAQYGNRKTRYTPLEQWEDALAKFSGIPEREIAEIHTYEILTAIQSGREGKTYKIKQRPIDLEKVFGKEKLRKLSAARITIEFGDEHTKIPGPDFVDPPAAK